MGEQGEGQGIGKFKKALIGLGLAGAATVAAEKGYLHDAPQEPKSADASTAQTETEKRPNPFLRKPVVKAEALDTNGAKVLVDGIVIIPGTENTQIVHYSVKPNENSTLRAYSDPDNSLQPVDLAQYGISPENGLVAHPVYGEPDEESALSNPILNSDGQVYKTSLFWEVEGKNGNGEKSNLYFPAEALAVTDPKPVISVNLK